MNDIMTIESLQGSCLCGGVRFSVEAEPERFYHCHCSRCRKATGTGHASNLFLTGSLTWERGEELIAHYQPPDAKRFRNSFCSRCGSRLPRWSESSRAVFVPAGSLDNEPGFAPQARIFTGSRAGWSCQTPGLPEWDEYPEPLSQ